MGAFSNRLTSAVRRCRTPLVVGLDPRWDQLPSSLTQDIDSADAGQAAGVICTFCKLIIDVVASRVPAVKPQWAFFERWGSAGMAALEQVIIHARLRGLLVIADAKRGDIGSTAEAYADAFFGAGPGATHWSPPFCDAVTLNPYLGTDTLRPFLDLARQVDAGVFVLVKTSNRGSSDFQDLPLADDRKVYHAVAQRVAQLATETRGDDGWGDVGAVVGATYPQQLAELRGLMPESWILVPGFGAQGGSAADTAGAFRADGLGGLVNSSRGIIFAFHDPRYRAAADWQRAVESACLDAIAQLRDATPAGQL